jgi:hypothetical protein
VRLLEVTWVDSGIKAGWQKFSNIFEWMEDEEYFQVVTVGLLLAEHPDYIVLLQGTSVDNGLSPIRIIRSNIISLKEYENGTEIAPDFRYEEQEEAGGEG